MGRKYKFKAKDIKTGEWVEGDLIYAYTLLHKTPNIKYKPMIVSCGCHGGMVWVGERHFVDENTIELIKNE